MSVTHQPRSQGFNYSNEWSAGLFECCTDCKSCLCAYFCMPCFCYSLFKDANECGCTPFCCPFSTILLRAKLRAHYKIEGAIWKDVCIMQYCGFCALVQMANELKQQGDAQ